MPYLPERMEIQKVKKAATNLHDKTEYIFHVRNLKQALYHGLVWKNVHRVIKFNQNAWLKPYIDINAKLRHKTKNDQSWWIMQFLEKIYGKCEEK